MLQENVQCSGVCCLDPTHTTNAWHIWRRIRIIGRKWLTEIKTIFNDCGRQSLKSSGPFHATVIHIHILSCVDVWRCSTAKLSFNRLQNVITGDCLYHSQMTHATDGSYCLTSPSKSPELDPLPSFLIKDNVDEHLPLLHLLCLGLISSWMYISSLCCEGHLVDPPARASQLSVQIFGIGCPAPHKSLIPFFISTL